MSLDQDGFLDGSVAHGISEQALPDPIEAIVEDSESHPIAQLFTIAFKVVAVIFFLFGNSSFTFSFVTCVIMLAFDFWVVKNVSGRLLVGLRWWHEVQPDGSDRWIFESRSASRKVHPMDSRVFWLSMYVTPLGWLTLALSVFFSVTNWAWMPIVVMALALSIANLIGYYKCDRDAKKKIQSFIAQRL